MNQVVNGAAVNTAELYKYTKPDAAFATLDPTESLAEGIGASYAVVGYKGKILSLRYRGEKHVFLRPDDGTPAGYLDVVILRQAKVKAKSYYPGGFEEGGSDGKRPVCASIDGVKPDSDVQAQQSNLCAVCPHNEWRTDENGRKGRDCTDYKRLAVLIMPHQTAGFFGGQPLLEPAFLRIPPDSLQDLGVFGDNLSAQGWPYSSYVTRISFDPQKSHPKFVFKFLHGLTAAEAPTIISLREDTLAKRITGEDEIARRAALPPPLQGKTDPAFLPPQGALQGVTTLIPPLPSSPVPVTGTVTAFATAPPVPTAPAAAPPAQQVTLEATRTLPGGAFNISPPPAEQAPSLPPGAMVGQTAADVGEAVADPDLDAKIKAMLST